MLNVSDPEWNMLFLAFLDEISRLRLTRFRRGQMHTIYEYGVSLLNGMESARISNEFLVLVSALLFVKSLCDKSKKQQHQDSVNHEPHMMQKQRMVSQRRLSYVLTRELRKSQDRLFVAPSRNESLKTIVHAERLDNTSRG